MQGEYDVVSVANPVTDGDATTTGLKIHYRVKVNPNGSWSTFTLDDNVFDPTLFKVPGPPATRDPADNLNDMLPPLASAGGSLTQIILTWDFVANAVARVRQPQGQPATRWTTSWATVIPTPIPRNNTIARCCLRSALVTAAPRSGTSLSRRARSISIVSSRTRPGCTVIQLKLLA